MRLADLFSRKPKPDSDAQSLEQAGYWVAAIRPPTVPEGRARLRVTLSALHGVGDVDGLVEAMAKARDRIDLGITDVHGERVVATGR